MLTQIMLASCIIALCIVVEAIFIGAAIAVLRAVGQWFLKPHQDVRLIIGLSLITLWLLAGLSLCVWIWAGTFLLLGLFASLETSLYFSVTAFTTLGFGDIVLPQTWRLLSGFAAASGLILFSLTTGFLFESVSRLRDAQEGGPKKNERK